MPTWEFNGRYIGRLDQNAPFDVQEKFTFDAGFKSARTNRASLHKHLTLIARNVQDGSSAFPIHLPGKAGSQLGWPKKLQELSHCRSSPPNYERMEFPGDTAMVVNIPNESALTNDESLEIDLNLQGVLEWKDDCKEFRRWLLDNAMEKRGYTIRDRLDTKLGKGRWDIQVWVLPQDDKVFSMFRWDICPTRKAHTWLNPNLVDRRGRKLYIEAVIVKNKGSKLPKKESAKQDSADNEDSDVGEGAGTKSKPQGSTRTSTKNKKPTTQSRTGGAASTGNKTAWDGTSRRVGYAHKSVGLFSNRRRNTQPDLEMSEEEEIEGEQGTEVESTTARGGRARQPYNILGDFRSRSRGLSAAMREIDDRSKRPKKRKGDDHQQTPGVKRTKTQKEHFGSKKQTASVIDEDGGGEADGTEAQTADERESSGRLDQPVVGRSLGLESYSDGD